MPRSQQSREAAIVAYFRTADLMVAQVVLKLAADEVKTRVTKSTEARERAVAAQKKAAPKPAPKPQAGRGTASKAHPQAVTKAKVKSASKPRRKPVEPPYTEDDLNGSESQGY